MNQLSFIVCGVPRSGTTLFVDVLNQQDDIFCFSEAFEYFVDPLRLRIPDDSRSKNIPGNIRDRDLLVNTLSKKLGNGDVFLGNKSPRYYLTSAINTGLPVISIERDVLSVARSWSAKAKSNTWHPGQDHIFSILEKCVYDDAIQMANGHVNRVDFSKLASGESISLGSGLFGREVSFSGGNGTVSRKSTNRSSDNVDDQINHLVGLSRVHFLRNARELILNDPLRHHFLRSIYSSYYFKRHIELLGIHRSDINNTVCDQVDYDKRLIAYRKASVSRNNFKFSLSTDLKYRLSAIKFYAYKMGLRI